MIPFSIQHIGVYRDEQHIMEKSWFSGISLIISGVRKLTFLGRDLTDQVPLFVVTVKGEPIEVDFGPDRENWVVVFKDTEIRADRSSFLATFNTGTAAVGIPMACKLPEELVPGWRAEFQKMTEAFQSPTPRNIMRAELGICSILRYMLDADTEPACFSPAYRLKRLIDEDTGFRQSIERLSRECGYSSDHLRVIFEREFHKPPHAYRAQRRMTLAMDYISSSVMTVKEISATLGFRHVSAFVTAFKKHLGYPPGKAIMQFRQV